LPGPGSSYQFGNTITTGNDLEVTYYNFSRKRSGAQRIISENEYFDIIRKFVEQDWDTSRFNSYYRSAKKLYAQTVTVPRVTSVAAPLCFNEDPKLNWKTWAAHYKGKITHKDGITFRLWGLSDNVLNVAINGDVVLSANGSWSGNDAYKINENFQGAAPGSRTIQREGNPGIYSVGNSNETLMGSDWITLEPLRSCDRGVFLLFGHHLLFGFGLSRKDKPLWLRFNFFKCGDVGKRIYSKNGAGYAPEFQN